MAWPRLLILLLALIEAGWLALDGTRALVVGDFITPRSGPHAGQVGPWSHLVARLGVNPRGTSMKVLFASYGWAWLALAVAFALGATWSWGFMLAAAVGMLWFLPFGTVVSALQIALLLTLRARLT